MLGNDVIDLDDEDADVATYSSRWSRRVFTRREAALVDAAVAPDRMRWRVWAAKEAAYKRARQIDPSAIFAPRAFEVTFSPVAPTSADRHRRGHVAWRGVRVPLFLEEGEGWLHAWVDDAGPDEAPPYRGVAALPAEDRGRADGPSRFVRRCVIDEASLGPLREAALPGDLELQILRDERVPAMYSRRGKESASLSLSHHGRFVAWAWRPASAVANAGSTVSTSNDSMNGVWV
jgi:hypothetical protein